MHTNTAKNFVIQLGSLITLYVSLVALITLVFGIINIVFPDQIDYWSYDGISNQIRFGIAMLIVFFPTYLVLTRMVNTMRRKESDGAYLTLTKWMIYLSLLVGGLIILGDFVAIILAFLNGELTTRFLLKALTLLLIIGDAFVYYALDAKGYWTTREKESKLYALVISSIVLVAIVFGFTRIELPAEKRALLFDQERVADLQNIQSQIGEYYRGKQILPDTITELESIGFGFEFETDPETEEPYTYTRVSDTEFELCATFNSNVDEKDSPSLVRQYGGVGIEGNWTHDAGFHCFSRSIDPDFFKPFSP